MAKGGRRYPLVIYTHMLDRWRPAILLLGFALLGLSWAVYSWEFEDWRWLAFAGIGGLTVFAGLLLWIFRKGAYVQPFGDHLKLATPFLRLNISYKRFMRSTSANMGVLFPPNAVSKWQADIVQPVAKMTALVIEMNAYPLPRSFLRFFLSPLFFKDKTAHLVILVDEWMKFSAELESMRAGTDPAAPQRKRDDSILSRLPNKNK
jgi:hypothetical protein